MKAPTSLTPAERNEFGDYRTDSEASRPRMTFWAPSETPVVLPWGSGSIPWRQLPEVGQQIRPL